MAKYKRKEVEEDEVSYSQEMAQEQSPSQQGEEENTYQKRYGDLRRHTQGQLAAKDAELKKLQDQLNAAAKGQIRFPKTDDEIDKWSAKYPDVAKIVDTIAQKRASEALQEGEKRMESLRQLETKLTRKEAEQKLMQDHPDFAEIRSSQKFHEWVALQPTNLQDALYKNNTDALAASRAIDLYKSDTGNRTKASKSAAQSVGRTSSSRPTTGGKVTWSESMVEGLSDKEYDKYEDEILEAMRTPGKFSYDVSGGAR